MPARLGAHRVVDERARVAAELDVRGSRVLAQPRDPEQLRCDAQPNQQCALAERDLDAGRQACERDELHAPNRPPLTAKALDQPGLAQECHRDPQAIGRVDDHDRLALRHLVDGHLEDGPLARLLGAQDGRRHRQAAEGRQQDETDPCGTGQRLHGPFRSETHGGAGVSSRSLRLVFAIRASTSKALIDPHEPCGTSNSK